MQKLTKDILIGQTRGGSEWWAYASRHTIDDVRIMAFRIGHFGGTPTAEAKALVMADLSRLASVSASNRTAPQPAPGPQVTVVLGSGRAAIVDYFAPVEGEGVTLLETRVKGTREGLEEMADRIDPYEWADAVQAGFNGDLNDGLREAQHRASVKAAKATAEKILRAVGPR